MIFIIMISTIIIIAGILIVTPKSKSPEIFILQITILLRQDLSFFQSLSKFLSLPTQFILILNHDFKESVNTESIIIIPTKYS